VSTPQPAALAISRVFLWILIGFNLFGGVVILLGLPLSFVFEPVFQDFFTKRSASIHPAILIWTLRVWGLLGLAMIAAVHVVLVRLLAMIATVREGDPFVPENAVRLKTIAWCLLGTQILYIAFGIMARLMNLAGSNIDWKWSWNGWLAVVLTFVLARVFEEGTRIRADLKAMI
jgi:hypothetical protein